MKRLDGAWRAPGSFGCLYPFKNFLIPRDA
jgi:hypothetical protein